MITGDEKWVTYDKVKRKRSWSISGGPAQTVAKSGLTVKKVLQCVWWDWQESSTMSCSPTAKLLIRTCTVNNWTN
ncbi:Histone-lysine N-methyltransferase SETMAR [Caligus rogercresseyi]|uniref:Histone-lysine N-methyltransferase SETMAR n=1 Tax=Caligus rogercresseyi TaxID=217165 RepID=A0A7T8HJN8_CALRO|nr:Histone-lysine N-methyltransferase SETMAR [Caligus rogercresseyi]